jgi:hypothetical protein
LVFKSFNYNNSIFIPYGDSSRVEFLGDPLPTIIKSIFIYDINNDKIYEILHYQKACIDLNTKQLYIENIPDIYNFQLNYENIHLEYYNDDNKTEPNFAISNTEYKIYKFENVINYDYIFCHPEIIIRKIKNNTELKANPTYYFIFDDYGLHGFGHWVYESFIFFPILEELNKLYPNIKILTTNEKKYVSNLLDFIGIKNEIVYEIIDKNNVCFIPPIFSLNYSITTEFNNFCITKFVNRIELNTIKFNYNNNILFLPRNKKDNYFPSDKIPLSLLRERRNQDEIDYISDGVIKNGGTVLNTYEINNFFIQFSLIMNSKNIILDYGSSYMVNCIACKNKNIIILNPRNDIHYTQYSQHIYIHNNIAKNNNLINLTTYNCYEDIEKYLI